MTDQKETTATVWEDLHAGKRGHQLMTRKLAETIPAIYANEKVADYDTVLAHAKLFSPYSNWTWYITEMDPETGRCFGLVEGLERELGHFDLTELAETTVLGGVPAVERDLYWEPRTLGKIRNGSREGSPHRQETGKGDTMTDYNEPEDHASDVVNVEEFLFDGAADDAPAEAEGECPAGDTTDDMDAEAPDEPDTETADDEPGVAEDAEGQPAPAEAETSAELKVVLSIRGGRATIGVHRPSADPYIESFDDPDLFGLADQFSAVVARAKARWEDEPMHPAYVEPAPPPRQRNRRRQQGTARPRPLRKGRQRWNSNRNSRRCGCSDRQRSTTRGGRR